MKMGQIPVRALIFRSSRRPGGMFPHFRKGRLQRTMTTSHLPHDPVWMFHSVPEGPVRDLAAACGIPIPLARILYQRGYTTTEGVKGFLHPLTYVHPDPFTMLGMEAAVERIIKALDRGERILVYGDYDVDGQASTALLVSALRSFGGRVDYYIPSRLHEGYGLSCAAISELAPNVDLLITVDCGITSTEEVALAAKLGVDCIITDHHEPQAEVPAAVAVIDPKQEGCPYPEKELAGCGVAYKLACAISRALGRSEKETEDWLDLVALATIADVVPLIGENRALVAKGLARFDQRLGLRVLCEVAGVDPARPRSGQVAFSVAPRLNAAGRLDDATVGVRLLLTDDSVEAHRLAELVDSQNRERQDVERRILAEAEQLLAQDPETESAHAIVVAGEHWHPGVIGIVASRLVEGYGRPALVVAVDGEEAVGSGRSIGPFNLFDALSRFKRYFTHFGGHSMAAGFSLPAAHIADFRREFMAYAKETLSETDLAPLLRVEAILKPEDITLELADTVQTLAPFGVGNPQPLVMVEDGLVCESRPVGKGGDHWRLALRAPGSPGGVVGGIGFGLARIYSERIRPGDRVDVAGNLGINEWNGSREPQLHVRDVRRVQSDIFRRAERELLAPDDAADGFPAPPPIPFVRQDGGRLRLFDWREQVGDVRAAALQTAADECDLVLLWTRSEGRQGLISRIVTEGTGNRVTETYLFSSHLPEAAMRHERVALVFWSVPPEYDAFVAVVQAAGSWAESLDVHLTFTDHLLTEARAELARDVPDIPILRDLYRAVFQGVSGRQGAVRLADLAADLAQRGVAISVEGVAFGLEVFAEAGLIRLQLEEDGRCIVEIEPTGGRKVDLTKGLRYNEGIILRERFSGYLTQIASVTGEELLDAVHRSVIGA